MEVRPCTAADLDRLRERWPTPDDVAGSHYEEQHRGTATFLVAWEGPEPLGCGLIQWRGCVGKNARAAFPRSVEVNHLHVRPDFRGRGAGRAIVAAAEKQARETGNFEFALGVGLDNADAARLYVRLGYRRSGVIDVCSYTWTDDQGGTHDEMESSELLVKRL